jgi:hypothetical protein
MITLGYSKRLRLEKLPIMSSLISMERLLTAPVNGHVTPQLKKSPKVADVECGTGTATRVATQIALNPGKSPTETLTSLG